MISLRLHVEYDMVYCMAVLSKGSTGEQLALLLLRKRIIVAAQGGLFYVTNEFFSVFIFKGYASLKKFTIY